MRLLIATPLYPPEPGGPATYSKLLEEDFPYPVTLVKFSEIRRYPKLVRHCIYFLHVFRAAKDADVILSLDPVSVGLPSLCAARLRRKKFVVKIVGDYAWEQGVQRFGITDTLDAFVRRARVPLGVSLLRAVQTHIAHSAKKIIVPSNYLKGIVSAWGVDPSKIEVIYNAVDLEEKGRAAPVALDLPRPLIVTVGRLVPWKRVDGIIDAVVGIEKGSLLIVGDGPERQALERKASAAPGRVHFAGALPHADALVAIKNADAFVLNSTYEGLSHVLIEALMLGKPVIATDVGGNRELILDEQNGILVPPSAPEALITALKKVLEDPEFTRTITTAARLAQQQFSADTMREKTADLLSRL